MSISFPSSPSEARATSCQSQSLTSWNTKLEATLDSVFDSFNAANSVRVWAVTDSSGYISWNAYDPVTGCKATELTQLELGQWLYHLYCDEFG